MMKVRYSNKKEHLNWLLQTPPGEIQYNYKKNRLLQKHTPEGFDKSKVSNFVSVRVFFNYNVLPNSSPVPIPSAATGKNHVTFLVPKIS